MPNGTAGPPSGPSGRAWRSASHTSAASTSGKSAVIAGPNWGPTWPAAGPVISVWWVIRVLPVAVGSSRCTVRTTKSPASISSVNSCPARSPPIAAQRGHRERRADRERAIDLDLLDAVVSLRPGRYVGPVAPDVLRGGGGLDTVFA